MQITMITNKQDPGNDGVGADTQERQQLDQTSPQTTTGQDLPPVLQTHDLAICAGGVVLHQALSFALQPAELVAVVGPSGSGKTTLLRTLVGLQEAWAGTVTLQGRQAHDWGWPQFRRRVVLVAQKPILFDETVEDNLRRPFAYRSVQTPFPHDEARRLLEDMGMEASCLSRPARQLSVGQQQRVALVRALLLTPLVLCLDEPTSALDTAAAEQVQQALSREAAQRGLAALIVTHRPQQAELWCDRKIELPGGRTQEKEETVWLAHRI